MPVPCLIWRAASGQSVATRVAPASRTSLKSGSASFMDSSKYSFFHAPRAVHGRAPLDGLDGGAGQPQQIGGLGAYVLRLEMAGQLIGDLGRRIREARVELARRVEPGEVF